MKSRPRGQDGQPGRRGVRAGHRVGGAAPGPLWRPDAGGSGPDWGRADLCWIKG